MTGRLLKIVMAEPMLDDYSKAEMLLKLAEADKSLVDGADEELQMLDICCTFAQIYRKRK